MSELTSMPNIGKEMAKKHWEVLVKLFSLKGTTVKNHICLVQMMQDQKQYTKI